MTRLPLLILITLLLSGCVNTYMEEKASLNFEPSYPINNFEIAKPKSNGSIYAKAGGGLFATDRRAQEIGDILTVNLSESFSSNKSQSASSGKTDSFDLTPPLGIVKSLGNNRTNLTGAVKNSFAGTGSASQSNSLTGKLSVTIVRVFDNGNLEIMGQKKLSLNNGNEYIRLSGVIRPEDITASNEVNSNRIAHAEITYTGAGDIHDSSQQGWLSRTLRNISPF